MPKYADCLRDRYYMIDWRRIKIERTNGPYPKNRYGVILRNLLKVHRKFLVEHRHIKRWAKSDQFVECAIKMQRPGQRGAASVRLYYDWENEKPVSLEEFKEVTNYIDWQCAISLRPIKAKFMNFDLENFVHPEYHDTLNAPMVDSRILKSSIEFRKKCKALLLEERQNFLDVVKKGSKKKLN